MPHRDTNRRVMMRIFRKPLTWLAAFGLLFLASQDYWAWDRPANLSFLNIPQHVYDLMLLQFILAALLLVFVKAYWQRTEKQEDADAR